MVAVRRLCGPLVAVGLLAASATASAGASQAPVRTGAPSLQIRAAGRVTVGAGVALRPMVTAATPATYRWSFDDGARAVSGDGRLRSLTHVFARAGHHIVTLTVRTTSGRTLVRRVSVTVVAPHSVSPTTTAHPSPPPTSPPTTAGPPPSVPSGGTSAPVAALTGRAPHALHDGWSTSYKQTVFVPTGSGDLVRWALDFGDGSDHYSGIGAPTGDVEHVYESPGHFAALLTVEDRAGRVASTTLPMDVTSFVFWEHECDKAGVSGQPFSCHSKAYPVEGDDEQQQAWTWSWGDGTMQPANGRTQPSDPTTHVYTAPGRYTLDVYLLDDHGGELFYQETVTIG